jgi:hypothetical protein
LRGLQALSPRRWSPLGAFIKLPALRVVHDFEHNYGHGEQHLSVVFAMLMWLAFLVDQARQLCCAVFERFG